MNLNVSTTFDREYFRLVVLERLGEGCSCRKEYRKGVTELLGRVKVIVKGGKGNSESLVLLFNPVKYDECASSHYLGEEIVFPEKFVEMSSFEPLFIFLRD